MSARLDAGERAGELLRSIQRKEKPRGRQRVLSQPRFFARRRSNYFIRQPSTPTRRAPVSLCLLF